MSLLSPKPFVLLVPSPGMGHLIPFLELANFLVTHHNFQASVVVISSSSASQAQSDVIRSATTPKLFEIIEIITASGHVNAAGSVFTQLPAIMHDSRSSLVTAITAMQIKPTSMIVDLFGTVALTVAEEFHMLKYVMVTCAWPLSLLLYSPILDKKVTGEYLDQEEPIKIPGCKSVRPEDVVKPMMNRKDPEYESFIRIGKEMTEMSDGILVNTWETLEETSLRAMREDPEWKNILKVPVYTFGPVIRPAGKLSDSSPRSEVLAWLDTQPRASVLFISFGSGGVLSTDQIIEMAWGLENSKQRFIWVLHAPKQVDEKCSKDVCDYLPLGFMDRTRDKGLVITTWAPQMEILGHLSTGAFLSHCGWNSTLESLMNGVPMIAWPLYAEQKMNATFLVETAKVAIRTRVLPGRKVADREEIETLVRKILEEKEGDEMRERALEVKKSGEAALSKGGSSFEALSELAKLCLNNSHEVGSA